ncbi:tubulin-folding cofactor B [Collybia nuda]|uniref:Tubulin-folding cofactor B n=1 Tax=Collybia nuda TaxID=64659 RepID=A0A9P6CLD2_9AGAR|nr:tubulin-folding cofactor B [Collybia nuda]
MSGVVRVFVISPDTRSERRLELHTTVQKLKGNLELITGIPVANQIVSLLNSENDTQVIAVLNEDERPLGFYGLRDWHVLKVEDANPAVSFTGQLTDVSQVEKFELTGKEYEERRDTVLAYKQRNKMGRFAPKDDAPVAAPPLPVNISVGSRCEVESLEPGLSKRGVVRFVGETKFGKGIWVGVEYDEPFGKNNGSVQGEQYFSCRANYGVFVNPNKVKVGDYPIIELGLDDEEM